jgi:hypothetical protein
LLLGGGVLVVPTAAASVTETAPKVVPSAPATEAPDAEAAAWLAHKWGNRVEVLAERTELTQMFAEPDGSFTTRQSATPQRVRRGSGWVPVDTTLQRTADGLTPAATTLDMHFSAGGTGPLLTFGNGAQRVQLRWPTALPAPVVSGAKATYPEVLPGVDLELTATADSFGEVLVVKNGAAAKNPALSQLRFGVTASDVTLRQAADDKVIQAVDAQGSTAFVSDGAAMWDTPTAEATAQRRVAVPSVAPTGDVIAHSSVEPRSIPVTLSAQTLTVTPAQDMLTDATTNFPVYIDPGFNGGKEIWTVVSRLHPDTSYWTNSSMRDYMRVGQDWHSSSSDDWRTIVQFNIGTLAHTQIRSASVLTTVWHSADCTASPLGLYRTSHISTDKSVTWNNTKSTDSTTKWWALRTVNASANKHECPKGNDEVEFGDPGGGPYKIRDAFQQAADHADGTITFGFRAPDESDEYQWKKLVKDSTYLDVNYNRKPGRPTAMSVSPCDKNPCANPAKTNSKSVQLKMTATDPDGGSLRYEFEVYDNAGKVLKAKSGSAVTGVKVGTSRGWTVVDSNKKALPDGTYQWRARACDSYWCGDYSGWYGLTIDTTNPGAPKLSAAPYKPIDSGEADAVPSGYGGPGTPGELTLSPAESTDAVTYYNWWFTAGDTKVHQVTAGANGVGVDHFTPTREGKHTIRAYAADAAGNRTQSDAEYSFKVAPAGGQWVWHMNEVQPASTDSLPQPNRPLKVAGAGVTWADRDDGYALSLDGRGELATDLPVLDTTADSGFTVAAWVKLDQDPDTAETPPDLVGDTPAPDPTTEPTPTTTGDPGDDTTDPGDEGDTPLPSIMDNTMTAVSQDGVHTSMFRLGYRPDLDLTGDGKPDRAWCFTLKDADMVTSPATRACSTAYVHQGEWVHLVGVADRPHNQLRLYVNGGPGLQHSQDPDDTGVMAAFTGSAAWAATGSFSVGRGLADGDAERWHGQIDDVYAVPRVWSDTEVEIAAAVDDETAG